MEEIILDLQRLENAICQIKGAVAEQGDISNLADSIASIKQAFESHWQENYIPLAEKILDKLNEGIPTPVLTVCGQGTREIRFTQYLAYYLDPCKNHGLGNRLLKSVLGPVTNELPPIWADECEVIPEIWIGYDDYHGEIKGCICDIGILGSNYAIIIEQKILSGEDTGGASGIRQLQRYTKVLLENPKFKDNQLVKVYLTPSGRIPETADGWLPMSYDDVINGCYRLLNQGNLTVTVRENLRSFLIDLIIGPYEDTEELIQEIKSLAFKLVNGNFFMKDVLSFSSITNDNRMLINVIMEGES